MAQEADELIEKARAATAARRWQAAIEGHERVLKHYPELSEQWFELARAQSVLGMLPECIVSLETGLELLSAPEQVDRALEFIDRLLQLEPLRLSTLQKRIDLLFASARTEEGIARSRELAALYLERDEGEQGIKILLRAFQLQPGNEELVTVLAEAYLSFGHLREATGLFRQILPAIKARGETDKAAAILRRLTVVNPNDVSTFMELGDLYIELCNYAEADQQFRKVLRIDLQHRDALMKIGEVSELRQQFRDASLIYNRLLGTDPEDAQARHGLGRVYQRQGMPGEAIKNLLMAGLAYLETNDRLHARECFTTVLKIDPENRIAARQLQDTTATSPAGGA